jgi:hypothetical protein
MVSADAAREVEGATTTGAVVAAAVAVRVSVTGGVVGVVTVEPQPANTIARAIPAAARGI